MEKEFKKKIRRAVARYAFFCCRAFLKRFSYNAARKFAGVLSKAGYFVTGRQRKIARESLQIAFGNERSPEQIDRIIKDCFANLGKGMVELIYFADHPHLIREKAYFEGLENLEAAFERGNGVIGIMAHFGNFPLMLMRFAQEGYPTSAIIRATRDEKIEKHFLSIRERFSLKTIYAHPRKECVSQSIKSLRNNEIVFIPIDQNFGAKGGVFVDFFGQKAATAPGPVIFALRTKAQLLPVFTVREADDRHKIIIEKPISLELKETDDETVLHNTQRMTDVIEAHIRRYPEEWSWMHRRWKSRPQGEGQHAKK